MTIPTISTMARERSSYQKAVIRMEKYSLNWRKRSSSPRFSQMPNSQKCMENFRRSTLRHGDVGRLVPLVVRSIRLLGYWKNWRKIRMREIVVWQHGILSISTRWLLQRMLQSSRSVMDSLSTRSRMGSSMVSSISVQQTSFSVYHLTSHPTHSSSISSLIFSVSRQEDWSTRSEMCISMRIISSRWGSRWVVLHIHFHKFA